MPQHIQEWAVLLQWKAQMVALSLLPVLRGRFAEVSKVSEILLIHPGPETKATHIGEFIKG